MSQSTQNKLSSKVLEKTISASIKKEIAAVSINTTTRKGNSFVAPLIQTTRTQLNVTLTN